jgi:phospho-N-acetylmuramoyl-pentapeptide-transferase
VIHLLGKYLAAHVPFLSFLRLTDYLSFRAIAAALTSVVLTMLLCRRLIRLLHRRSLIDQARITSLPSSSDKRGTPTMGGAVIVGSVVLSSLLWCNPTRASVLWVLAAFLWFGAIGFLDDLAKSRGGSAEKGLSEKKKLVLQGAFAVVFAVVMATRWSPVPQPLSTTVFFPFFKMPIVNAGWLWIPIVLFFVLFVGNSVNITDGLDGLAIVPSVFAYSALGVFGYVMGNAIWSKYLQFPFLPGSGELMVLCSAFLGAGIGFLWYNAYPAQIFMGDTGSLAIGGGLAVLSAMLKQEFLFPLLGGLFLAEGFTSQWQDKIGVKWIGRRIFDRAPLHHALQYQGLAETKVVIRLWILSGLLAIASLATLKLR